MSDFVVPVRQAVTLSETAVKHFAATQPGKIVVFAVEGGSCAGLKYTWKIVESEDQLHNDDEIIDYKDFKFAVDGASLLFVISSKIDYVSDIVGSRIEIVNPNATASCGCGESFNANI